MHCPSCWNSLPGQAGICPHCGRALSLDDMRRQRELEEKINMESRGKGGCLRVVLVAALLVLLFGLIRTWFLRF